MIKSKSLPIRVLHAVHKMDRGGIETFLMRIYRAIDRKQVQFDFLVHKTEPGAYDEEIHTLGGRIFPIEFRYNPLYLPHYIKDLKDFFKDRTEYQIVHAHLNAFNGIFLSTAASSNVTERIAHIHTQSSGSFLREPLWDIIKRIGRRSFTQRYACSKEAGLWAYGNDVSFTRIENGIPLNLFAFDREARTQIRDQYNLNDHLIIGHVGAFRHDKNQSFLLDILIEVRKHDTSAMLLLIGNGTELPKVKAKAIALGLSEYVVFTSEVANPEKYYSAMDIFAFPSINEGLGIVAIEAQASGLPTIFSTGVPVEAAATELAVRLPLKENTNEKQWAAEILSHAGQKRVIDEQQLKNFDIKNTTKMLEKIYLTT